MSLLQACESPPPNDSLFVSETSSLNLGYEELTNDGQPEEWLVLAGNGEVKVAANKHLSFQGDRCLHFQSQGNNGNKSQCLNSLLADIVKDSIEISAFIRYTGDTTINFGFFYQSHGIDTAGQATIISVDKVESDLEWYNYKITILASEICGNFLDFGFWLEGNGELWLDAWDVKIDQQTYESATEKRISPLSKKAIDYLSDNLIPLEKNGRTLKTDDFSWLRSAVEDIDIVLLGESTHGTSDFFKLKKEITQFLIEEMNFTTVILEANLPETLDLNKKLRSGLNDIERVELIDSLHFWMYRTTEFLDFVKWFEELDNTKYSETNLAGCDLQHYDFPLMKLKEYSLQFESPELNSILLDLQTHISDPKHSIYWADSLKGFLESQLLSPSIEANTQPRLERMLRYAEVILNALKLRYSFPPYYFRDRKMAENIMWLADRNTSQKVIVWAHNEHIQRGNKAISYWLDKEMEGRKIFTLGLATGGGNYQALDIRTGALRKDNLKPPPPESWEYYFRQTGVSCFFLDFRNTEPQFPTGTNRRMRMIGGVATPKQFYPADITEKFDALIYLDSTSATHFY